VRATIERILFKASGRSETDLDGVVVRGAASWVGIRLLGAVVGFLVQLLLAREMGAEQYGTYVYVVAWANVLAIGARLGFDVVLVRNVADYTTNRKWDRLKGLFVVSEAFTLATGAAIGAIVAIIVWSGRGSLGTELVRTFWLGTGLILLTAVVALRHGALRGLRRVGKAELPLSVLTPLLLGALVVLSQAATGREPRASQVMGLHLIAMAAAATMGTYWLFRLLPDVRRATCAEYRVREWTRMAVPLAFLSGMNLLIRRTDVLMIGAYLGTVEAGVYHVASRFANLCSYGMLATNSIAAPLIAELYRKQDTAALQRVLKVAAWASLALTLPACFGAVVVGEPLLRAFGQEYAAGYWPLAVLALAQLLASLGGAAGFLLTMTRYQREAAVTLGLTVLLNVLLNLLFIPRWGLVGAACATTLSLGAWRVRVVALARRHIGLQPTIF
jgi:O-antigen/teichoic acid export membrane protein